MATCFINCKHTRKPVIVRGDTEAAKRNFNDTTHEQLYIEQGTDTARILIHGKYWYTPSDCHCDLAVLLDGKPLPISDAVFTPDGSFTFHLMPFSTIRRHTLSVSQKKSDTEFRQSDISFYILGHDN